MLSYAFLFVVVTGIALLALRPKSYKLRRISWGLLIGGTVMAMVSLLIYSYSLSFDIDKPALLPWYFGWVGVGGMLLGPVLVVASLIVVIVARMRNK